MKNTPNINNVIKKANLNGAQIGKLLLSQNIAMIKREPYSHYDYDDLIGNSTAKANAYNNFVSINNTYKSLCVVRLWLNAEIRADAAALMLVTDDNFKYIEDDEETIKKIINRLAKTIKQNKALSAFYEILAKVYDYEPIEYVLDYEEEITNTIIGLIEGLQRVNEGCKECDIQIEDYFIKQDIIDEITQELEDIIYTNKATEYIKDYGAILMRLSETE